MRRFILLLFTAFSITACTLEEETVNFRFTNNTSEEIYVSYDFDNPVVASFVDPASNSANIIPAMGSFLQSAYLSLFSQEKEMTLIIVTKSVYDSNTWQDIVDNDLYDVRYDVTLAQLRDMNNEFIYD